jgi:hypothetical protein
MLIAAVGPRWCRHREEMIYTCTYSEMRILQFIVSGTLANAGRPERVINKTKTSVVDRLGSIGNFNPALIYIKRVAFGIRDLQRDQYALVIKVIEHFMY